MQTLAINLDLSVRQALSRHVPTARVCQVANVETAIAKMQTRDFELLVHQPVSDQVRVELCTLVGATPVNTRIWVVLAEVEPADQRAWQDLGVELHGLSEFLTSNTP